MGKNRTLNESLHFKAVLEAALNDARFFDALRTEFLPLLSFVSKCQEQSFLYEKWFPSTCQGDDDNAIDTSDLLGCVIVSE